LLFELPTDAVFSGELLHLQNCVLFCFSVDVRKPAIEILLIDYHYLLYMLQMCESGNMSCILPLIGREIRSYFFYTFYNIL